MDTVEKIQDPLELVQAYQHIRKTLKDAIPQMVEDITQTNPNQIRCVHGPKSRGRTQL
jgi:hypothetical protein